MELGDNIRARRGSSGMTLQALSKRVGVSRAMLSDVERGRKNPTIKIVSQIAEGLGCTVSELLGEEQSRTLETIQVLREDSRQVLIDPRSYVERHLLSPPLLRKGIEVIWYTIPPGQSTGAFAAHKPGVTEHITVVQGQLYCHLAEEEIMLKIGDSVYFRADIEHSFYNPGEEVCHYFLLIVAG